MTLLELLLVITIMVLAAAVAIPRYANAMSNYRADMAARRIVADLRWAQARARNQSTSQTITFNLTNSTYQVVGATDPDHIASGYTVDPGRRPILGDDRLDIELRQPAAGRLQRLRHPDHRRHHRRQLRRHTEDRSPLKPRRG